MDRLPAFAERPDAIEVCLRWLQVDPESPDLQIIADEGRRLDRRSRLVSRATTTTSAIPGALVLHQRRGYLTIRQFQDLADELAEHREEDATVVRFLALTGLRWGEMAALRVSSFDMVRRRVSITEAIAEVRGAVCRVISQDARATFSAVPCCARRRACCAHGRQESR